MYHHKFTKLDLRDLAVEVPLHLSICGTIKLVML